MRCRKFSLFPELVGKVEAINGLKDLFMKQVGYSNRNFRARGKIMADIIGGGRVDQ